MSATTSQIDLESGKAPLEGRGEQTQPPEFSATGATAPPKRERKSITCRHWIENTCTYAEPDRHDAHHLFPVIAERNARKGYKLIPCKYGHDCWWPRDVCGYSHDGTAVETATNEENHTIEANTRSARNSIGQSKSGSSGPAEDVEREKRAARVDELVKERPWCAKTMYICKRCKGHFPYQYEVIEHSKKCFKTDTDWGRMHARASETEGGSTSGGTAPTPPAAATLSSSTGGSNIPNQTPLARPT